MSMMSSLSSPRIKAVLIDLSGTLHVDDQAIPGCREAVDRLRREGVALKFVTNTTKESRRRLLQRLHALGFKIGNDEILTSLSAARAKVEREGLRPLLLIDDAAMDEFEGMSVEVDSPDSVVVGLAPERFDHAHMSRAMNVLLDGGRLIAIHKARYYKSTSGLRAGPGLYVAGLEYCTGVVADVVGKPEPAFFRAALESLRAGGNESLEERQVAMIGDDVKDDVAGAMAIGLRGILVRTGKYRDGDERKTNIPPDATCDNFSQAVDFILKNWT